MTSRLLITIVFGCALILSCTQGKSNGTGRHGEKHFADSCHHFDMFAMQPKGLSDSNNCIFYTTIYDTITLMEKYSSCSITITKQKGNGFVGECSFDLELKELMKDGRYPRTYKSFLGNDTIYELRHVYDTEKSLLNEAVIIKTESIAVFINFGMPSKEPLENGDLKAHIQSMCRNYKQKYNKLGMSDHIVPPLNNSYFQEEGYLELEKCLYKDYFAFKALTSKDTIYYIAPSHAMFSIAPGFELLKEIRIKTGAEPTVDGVYYPMDVDEMPSIATDGSSIRHYVDSIAQIVMQKSKPLSNSIVMVELVISTSGNVEHITICRSVGRREDELAKDIFRNLPPIIPAKRNGRPVSVRITVPVRFNRDSF